MLLKYHSAPAMMQCASQNTSISDLPEGCVSAILSRTSVKDVCTFASVSKIFYSASVSDIVWRQFLPQPHQCRRILSLAVVSYSSKFQLFCHLCEGLSVENSTKLIWLDKISGKICHMLSARSLDIVWGEDERYWNWVAHEDSRFGEVALLKVVWWLQIQGRVDCSFLSPNTTYQVSFVLKSSKERFYGFGVVPVKLWVTLPDGQVTESERMLQRHRRFILGPRRRPGPLDNAKDEWYYLVAGTFSVEHDWTLDPSESPKFVQFSLMETDCSHQKCGLIVDGVRIEPL